MACSKSREEVAGLDIDDSPAPLAALKLKSYLVMLADRHRFAARQQLHFDVGENYALLTCWRRLKNSEVHAKAYVVIKEGFDLTFKTSVIIHLVTIEDR